MVMLFKQKMDWEIVGNKSKQIRAARCDIYVQKVYVFHKLFKLNVKAMI